MKVDLMVDLETLGTTPGSIILSIAAVPFGTYPTLEPFYVKVSVDSGYDFSFHVDDSTIEWWDKQSDEAYDEAFSGDTRIEEALVQFSDYCAGLGEVLIWGNGADFDNVLLSEAYRICGIKQPWKYSNSRCYRTLKNLYPHVPYIKPEIAHNALQDAKAQARHAMQILVWKNSRPL